MFWSEIRHLVLGSFCLFLAASFTGCPQGPGSGLVGWIYNAEGGQTGHRIFENADRDVIAVGEARGSSGEKRTAYVRFRADGSILADRTFSDLRNPSGIPTPTATLLSNGDVLLAATTAQGDDSDNRLRVLRIDPDGNTLWDFTTGDVKLTPKVAVENGAGDILVTGNHTQGGFQLDVFFLLLSAEGDIVMFNQLEPLEDRSNFTVVADGMAVGNAFVVGGRNATQDASTISVIKLDENAVVTSWTRTTGPYNRMIGIEPVDDGYAIIAPSDSRIQLIKTDEVGEIVSVQDDIFSRANPDETSGANDFIVDSSGDIVMVGEGTTVRYIGDLFPQITIRPFIAKFTADGEKIWEKTINARGLYINGITETSDGGYATTGVTGEVNLNVIRFDHDGDIIN